MGNANDPVVGDRCLQVVESADFIAELLGELPRVAIILGSGLGGLVEHIENPVTIHYSEIPNWGRVSAAGHSGALVAGTLNSCPVIAMAGRFHRYEGWTTEQISFPIRVLSAVGAESLIVSNAAGGVNPQFEVGDIVVIRDHIDLMHGRPEKRFDYGMCPPATRTDSPLRGTSPYDQQLIELAHQTASRENFSAHAGTYLATLGPNYETRAEYRFMRKIGADVVGMSTVPEVLQAQRIGMRILALSMVSNMARPDAPAVASHEEVLDAGQQAEPRLRAIVCDAVNACSA